MKVALEWFKDESLKLNDLVTNLRREVEKWKSKAMSSDDELKFLVNQLKVTRRENQLLKGQVVRLGESI